MRTGLPRPRLFDRSGVALQHAELRFTQRGLNVLKQLALFPADVIIQRLAYLSQRFWIRINLLAQLPRMVCRLAQRPVLGNQTLSVGFIQQIDQQALFIVEVFCDLMIKTVNELRDRLAASDRIGIGGLDQMPRPHETEVMIPTEWSERFVSRDWTMLESIHHHSFLDKRALSNVLASNFEGSR